MSNPAGSLSHTSPVPSSHSHGSVLSDERRQRWWLIVRLGVYLVAATLLLQFAVLAATAGHAAGLAIEEGPLEAVQVIITSFACTAFFFASVRHVQLKTLFELCALALLAFAVRELDNYLDESIARGAYMYVLVPICVVAAYLVWRGRKTLAAEIEAYVVTPSATMVLFGLFMLLCYAQIIGQPEFWRALSSDEMMWTVQRAVEEISQAPGYLFFLCGSIEALIWNSDLAPIRKSAV